jgi:hypothetical protein
VIFTDHKPLTYAFSQRRDKCSPRQFNHLDFISQFTTDIRHISGQENVVADALSRVEAVGASFSPEALAEAQDTDAELTILLQGATALRLEKIQVPGTDIALHCDTTTTRPRPTSLQYSDGKCSTLYTVLATSEQGRRRNLFPSGTCGRACRRTAAPGHQHTSLASGQRYSGTPPRHLGTSLCLHPGSSTCTSKSLAHFRRQTVSDTALRQ